MMKNVKLCQVIVRNLQNDILILSESMRLDTGMNLTEEFSSGIPIHIKDSKSKEYFSLNPDSYQFLTISLMEI